MGEFFQQIFLSDVVLFAMMGVVMILITSWAYSLKEYAGYILGWLLGILMIILISVMSTDAATSEEIPAAITIQGPFFALGLVLATFAGLGIGFGGLALVGSAQYRTSRARRALAVAITTSFTLTGGYIMLVSDYSTRLSLVVFTLALAIGVLTNYIFSRHQKRQQATPVEIIANPDTEIPEPYPTEPPAAAAPPTASIPDLPSPLAQRVHNIRTRLRRRE